MLPSETMIWQPEFTDKTLSRKPGAVHPSHSPKPAEIQTADLSGHRNGESGGCRIVVLLR
ncbi:hypothetical protein GC258_26525 [Escherichia coli]|nr:hypothetical protein [Escherichia coli]